MKLYLVAEARKSVDIRGFRDAHILIVHITASQKFRRLMPRNTTSCPRSRSSDDAQSSEAEVCDLSVVLVINKHVGLATVSKLGKAVH